LRTNTFARSSLFALALGASALFAAHSADAMCPRDRPDCNKPDGDPKQKPNRAKGPLYPAYYVLTLLYAPPGNQSTAEYAGGSSTGAETDVTNTFKGGPQIATQGNVEATVGWQAGGSTGHTFEVTKEVTKTLGLQSQIDPINHDYDTFYIWTNPQLYVDQTGDNSWSLGLAVKTGQTMSVVPVTVKELKNPSTMAAFKKTALAALTPSDYAQILALDPFANGSTTFASNRFAKVDSLQLDGPFEAGAPLNPQGLEVSNEQIAGKVSGFVSQVNVSVMVGTSFSFFGLLEAGLKVGGTFEWDYENTNTQKSGQKQTASVTLQTSTVGYNDVIDVYYDTVFKSFAFASTSGPVSSSSAALSGTVSKKGKPLSKQIVTVTMPNGQKRRVVTNANGEYRLFALPAGKHQVAVGGKIATFEATPGKMARLKHEAP